MKVGYYPFGLKHKGYNNVTSSNGNSVAQKWKFGGKEHNDELGLDWYDFGARNYDASLGRWMNLDPLADHQKQLHASPFAYANNDPIRNIDPDGMLWIPNDDGTYTAEDGDSAWTLYTQHLKGKGYTFKEVDAMVEQQYTKNRVEDGVEKSNIDEGDVVHEGKQVKSSTGLETSYVVKDSSSDNGKIPTVDDVEGRNFGQEKKEASIEILTMALDELKPDILGPFLEGLSGTRGTSTRTTTSSKPSTKPLPKGHNYTGQTVKVNGKNVKVIQGPQGGRYYVNSNGNRTSLKRDGTKRD